MSFHDSLFWILAAISVGSAAMILVSRGIVHMAFWLLASLAGFAGFYLQLGADFLGFAQVLIYIGGILILFLFGVMLTHRGDVPVRRKLPLTVLVPGVIAGLAVLAFAAFIALASPWQERPPLEVTTMGPANPEAEGPQPPLVKPTSQDIGDRFMSYYILPFEVVSLLLLVAMVGATYVARNRDEEAPQQRPEEETGEGRS